jgi:hypothetical protein
MSKRSEENGSGPDETQTIRRNVELGMQVYGFTTHETKNKQGEKVPAFLFDETTRKQALEVINQGLAILADEMRPAKQ